MGTATSTIDPGSLTTRDHSTTAADRLTRDQVRHIFKPGSDFGFVIGGTPTTREEIVFVASAAGFFRGFHATLNDTGSSTSITFDLKVNGSSVLSAVITLAHTDADKTIKNATISTPAFVANDIVSIAMTVSSSTGAQGPYAWASCDEYAE